MDLPQDVRDEIIKMALPSSDNLDETIKAIKASVLRGVRYDNLKTFTALMNVLAKKFPSTYLGRHCSKNLTLCSRRIYEGEF